MSKWVSHDTTCIQLIFKMFVLFVYAKKPVKLVKPSNGWKYVVWGTTP